ncbi:hypothetical protein [Staphylococcus xylosus]|uniref:hypothetical protein n=1 Tax=Staphylococcus xylosus TaxID=1288 RepID=UPI002DBE7AC5|nr:hypothetical protein [Staphylococcus xylosus]MEB7384474.1 hypothetical protein [Staphylococcus xylosus]MEB7831102.1 hypothetical protein [Staphylococcus xylosus]
MKTFAFFTIIFIFSALWTSLTIRYLPSETTGHKNNKSSFNTHQQSMIIEIFARTFIWFVYFLLLNIIMKYFGYWNNDNSLAKDYSELVYLLAIILLDVMNYFYVKRKYNSKG